LNDFWLTYSHWDLKFGQIFRCLHFFSLCLEDIDLIFGIWVYNDELQIKFTFCSGPMIFGRVMPLRLWNLAKYLVVTTLFHWFEILTWFLVWECMITSYRSTEIRSGWMIFGQLTAVGLWNLAKYLVVTTLFHYDLRYLLDFWYEVYNHKLQINFEIRSGWMIFGQLTAVRFWNVAKCLVVTTFFQCAWDIDLIFGIWVFNDELQIKFTFRSGPMIFGRVMALRLWNLAKYLVVTTLFHYDLRY
jgi:hypothetical protein